MLLHEPQVGPTGCLYHAAFALTHEPVLLDPGICRDVSEARFVARLAAFGLLLFPFWVTPAGQPTTPESFWRGLIDRLGLPGLTDVAPLLVSIPGPTPGWLHTVAVELPLLPGLPVEISDSNHPELLRLNVDQFLGSDYARACRVEMLGPNDLLAYPEDHRTPGGTE